MCCIFVTFYKALRSFGDLPDLVVDDTSVHFKDRVEQLMSSMLAGLLAYKKSNSVRDLNPRQ